MTPKEKANKLCMRFLIETTTDIPYGINKTIAKECALIAADEIMLLEQKHILDKYIELGLVSYYQEVKREIEAL
jgi:hypothetical protein